LVILPCKLRSLPSYSSCGISGAGIDQHSRRFTSPIRLGRFDSEICYSWYAGFFIFPTRLFRYFTLTLCIVCLQVSTNLGGVVGRRNPIPVSAALRTRRVINHTIVPLCKETLLSFYLEVYPASFYLCFSPRTVTLKLGASITSK
jgi:hypothetical protein